MPGIARARRDKREALAVLFARRDMGRTPRSLRRDTSSPNKAAPRPAKAPAPKVDLGADLRARISARQEQRAGVGSDAGFSYADFKQRRSAKEAGAAAGEEEQEGDEMLLKHLRDDDDEDDILLRMGLESEREAPPDEPPRSSQPGLRSAHLAVAVECERELPNGGCGSLGVRAARRELRKRGHSAVSKKRRDVRRNDLKYGGSAAAAAVESEREGAIPDVERMVWTADSTQDFVGDAAGEPPAVGTPSASAELHAALQAALPASGDMAVAAADATPGGCDPSAAAMHGGRPAACVRALWPAEPTPPQVTLTLPLTLTPTP